MLEENFGATYLSVEAALNSKSQLQAGMRYEFTHIKDVIFWDLVVDPERNIQFIQKTNFDNTFSISFSVSAPIHFTTWWESQNSILLVGQRVSSFNQEVQVKKNMNQIQFNTTQTLNLGQRYTAEIGGFYQSKDLHGLLVRRSRGSLNVGIQKTLKK